MVRAATAADLAAIARIENWAIEHTFAHFGTRLVTREEVAAAFEKSAQFPWFVADEDAAIVGFARCGPWKAREAYRWTVEIGVFVDPEWQGKGVGKALYEALFPELERRGFRTLLAGITLPNDASVRLHEALGMKQIGLIPKNGYKMGEWRDVGYWSCHLGDGPPGE